MTHRLGINRTELEAVALALGIQTPPGEPMRKIWTQVLDRCQYDRPPPAPWRPRVCRCGVELGEGQTFCPCAP